MEHPSYLRLLEVFDLLEIPFKAADIARKLNTSDQTITNWKKRGVSKDALIALSDDMGFRIAYVRDGEGKPFHNQYFKVNSPEHKALIAMQKMDEPAKLQAVRILNTLAEPGDITTK